MTSAQIAALLREEAGLVVEDALAAQFASYLELLARWNTRTNLTAIRDPHEIVLRHFGESLSCARVLPRGVTTLLDYGSGAGFPGLICCLARPEITVTLAESQGKKAAFLQEACRMLGVTASVHAGRVSSISAERKFGAVTLRAVDKMSDACVEAKSRVDAGGWLALMTIRPEFEATAELLSGVAWRPMLPLANSHSRVVALGRVLADVPRGTSAEQ